MRLTLKQTQDREEVIRGWIDEGKTINNMAHLLGIRPEAVRRFLKIRGWETEGMREYRERKEGEADPSPISLNVATMSNADLIATIAACSKELERRQ